jgi:hypothetical protein
VPPWFRKVRDELAPGPVATSDETPEALLAATAGHVRFVNRHAGRLPGAAVVEARYVTDLLREIVETSRVRPLDIHTLVAVKGIVYDYLPTTLERYLALDPDVVDVRRPTGSTPRESLVEQLRSLRGAADHVLTASRSQDVDALMTQGSFLATKFTGSDLDL